PPTPTPHQPHPPPGVTPPPPRQRPSRRLPHREPRHIQSRHRIDHKPCQVTSGQPLPHIRRQQKRLIPVTRANPFPHPPILPAPPSPPPAARRQSQPILRQPPDG